MENLQFSLQNDLQKLSEVVGVRPAETPRLKKGERREVAVIFLDLKDFTSISEIMDHEMVYDIVGGVMKTLADVVEGHGGYVDKIHGDQIMALFGAKKSGENDSIRAVSCGLRMLETIKEVNGILEEMDVRIDARVGISFGTVTVAPDPSGHLTAIGDVVNIASRLETATEINTILVTARVQKECGDLFDWKDRGDLEIRGKKKPVHVFSPTGPGSIQKARWERAARVARSPLVGREEELSFLRDQWKKQVSGELGTNRLGGSRHLAVGIQGEAGIGKSRLIHEFIIEKKKEDSHFLILHGQTLSYAQPPFWLWITVIHNVFGIDFGDQDAEQKLEMGIQKLVSNIQNKSMGQTLIDSKPFLAALLSISIDDKKSEKLDDKSKHKEMVMAIRTLVQILAQTERTVLILDDLHWMDSASGEALEFLLTNCITPEPLLVFCLHRPAWEAESSLLDGFHYDFVQIEELDLNPVSETGCSELIHHMLNNRVLGKVEQFLLKRSGGNPFFLEEMVLDLVESGILTEVKDRWEFTSALEDIYVPSSLNRLIRSRIDRLQPEFKGGLQHCSVLGMDFLMKLYKRLHEKLLSSGEPEEILNELTRKDFLRDVEDSIELKYMFRHFLIHDSAYDTLLYRNRRTLHRYTAEVIEEEFSEESQSLSPVIAHHWELAGNRKNAIKWGIRALKNYRKSYQNEEGLLWAGKLEVWIEAEPVNRERDEQLLTVLEEKQSILDLLGRRDEQRNVINEMFSICKKLNLDTCLGKVHRLYGEFCSVIGSIDEAQENLGKALELATENERALVYSFIGENYFRKSMYTKSLDYYKKVLELTDDSYLKAKVILSTVFICRIMGRLDEAVQHIDHAKILLREELKCSNAELCALYFTRKADISADLYSGEKAIEYYVKALDIYRKCGNPAGEAMVLNNMHWIYSLSGDYEKCLETLEEVERINRQIDDALGMAIAYYNLAQLYVDMNRVDTASEYFNKYLKFSEKINNELGEGYGKSGLGILYWSEGDLEKAEACLRESIEVFRKIEGLEMEVSTLLSLAEMFAESGRADEAEEILDSLKKGSFSSGTESYKTFVQGIVEMCNSDGEETRLQKALEFFRKSVSDLRDCDRRDIAHRYSRLAEVLEKLHRENDRKVAIAEGEEILRKKLMDVKPSSRQYVMSQKEIAEFLILCEKAGCPIRMD